MYDSLATVANILFILMFLTACRVLLQALFPPDAFGDKLRIIKLFYDIVIAISLVLLVACMWGMHWWNSKKERNIRQEAEDYQNVK